MSTQEESALELPPEQQTPRRHCRVQYRLRWFYSKGAFLILIWILLSSMAAAIPFNLFLSYTSYILTTGHGYFFYLISLLFILLFVSALFSGWIADSLLGNYRTVKAGAVVCFFSLTLFCILLILLQSLTNGDSVSLAILSLIFTCLNNAGYMSVLISLLQLGLDQMPDASTANITSFIAWFLLCYFAGVWLSQSSITLVPCINQLDLLLGYFEILSLLAVLCASVILCSDFLLGAKWLKNEPKFPQSLKGIFKVLKYAKEHKHLVQRSAFTFWEEELPSRIDFGKSKYGGPFTTEQVENVKTILRMLVIGIPMGIIFTSNYLLQLFPTSLGLTHANGTTVTENTDCSTAVVQVFTSNSNWWFTVGIVINEFAVYPLLQRSTTILKRFGTASFLLILVSSTYLILNIVFLSYTIEEPTGWSQAVLAITAGFLKIVMLSSALDFVCAQSPLDMRSLLIGYIWCIVYLSYLIDNILFQLIVTLCTSSYCAIIYCSLATALSILGFVLHLFLAHWYKRRVRDDIIPTQYLAEETYDRYLRENR